MDLNLMSLSKKPLPYLRRVAYLESHGTEWIDTGYKMTDYQVIARSRVRFTSKLSRNLDLCKFGGDRKLFTLGYTAKDYVQDGLIAMFDGIENVGFGVHGQSVQSWKNLIGNTDLNYVGGSSMNFSANALEISNNSIIETDLLLAGNFTSVEFVAKYTSLAKGTTLFATGSRPSANCDREIYWNGNIGVLSICSGGKQTGGYGINISKDTLTHSFSIGYSSANMASDFYFDGIEQEIVSVTDSTWYSGPRATIGGIYYNGSFQSFIEASIYSIRIYNKIRRIEDVLHDYAIDKARFNLA